MTNYINREEFKEEYLCCGYLPEMSEKEFDSFPAADVVPVRHGRWDSNDLNGYKWAFACSECGWVDGYPFNDRHNYCPNCGAKMDLE